MALLALSACATPEAVTTPASQTVVAQPAAEATTRGQDTVALDEARARLAQAESDIALARSRRALWSKAWESLIAARASAESGDAEATQRHARLASDLAQLGLAQLSYPPVR